jgi:MraZ protein
MFRGTFSVRVDEKGRLKLPAVVKQRLDEKYGPDAGYFVTSLTGDMVLIYALADWERIENTLSQTSQFDKSKRKFLFQTNHYGAEASADEQGRILIPGKLRDTAGMKGDVVLSWQSNHIEVLSQARYELEDQQNQLSAEDFENLGKLGI